MSDTPVGPDGRRRGNPLIERFPYDLRARRLTVRDITELSPTMRRITLVGPDLESGFPFRRLAATDHVKVLIPSEDTGALTLPDIGHGAGTLADAGVARDYTIRHVDHENLSLTIDFVRHNHGPAGRWASTAQPGADLGVLGPRGSQVYPGTFGQYVLIADETALPAAERFLEELPPATPVRLIVFGASEAAHRPLGLGAAGVRWLPSGADADQASLLQKTVTALPIGPDTFIWGAGEAGILQELRRHLRDTLTLPREQVDIRGYWRRGTAGALHH